MTLSQDEFRRKQRCDCPDGGGQAGRYGCPCCRKIADLNKHKKSSRKRARHKLKDSDRKDFDDT